MVGAVISLKSHPSAQLWAILKQPAEVILLPSINLSKPTSSRHSSCLNNHNITITPKQQHHHLVPFFTGPQGVLVSFVISVCMDRTQAIDATGWQVSLAHLALLPLFCFFLPILGQRNHVSFPLEFSHSQPLADYIPRCCLKCFSVPSTSSKLTVRCGSYIRLTLDFWARLPGGWFAVLCQEAHHVWFSCCGPRTWISGTLSLRTYSLCKS